MNTFVKVMHINTCNCAACASVPTLGIEMPYEEEKKKTAKTKKDPVNWLLEKTIWQRLRLRSPQC